MDTVQTQPLARAKASPKPKQKLHYLCTIVACGKDFDTFADLDNHTNTTHSEILEIPVRLSQGESKEIATKMLHDAMITTFVKDIESASIKYGGKEEHVRPPTPPAEEEISAALENAIETRPKLARWTSRMNRNTLANPGASLWKSA